MSLPYLQPYLGLSNGLNTLHAAGGGAGGGAVGGWKELGRTTLGSAGDTISVGSLSDKRYYMVLQDSQSSSTIGNLWRLNSDTGSNYAIRLSENGAADSTATSATAAGQGVSPASNPTFGMMYLSNLSSNEKLGISHFIGRGTAGAANAPNRSEGVFKWANTSNAVSTIAGYNDQSGDFASGSEVVVLGYDPSDDDTNGFWQELASTTWSSGASISSGVFTPKKYLWIQGYVKHDGNAGGAVTAQVGNTTVDTGSNYAWRVSENGGADGTGTSASNIPYLAGSGTGTANARIFFNCFIINNASSEKLGISHNNNSETAGAANAPTYREEQVFKWANTSNQINIITLTRGANALAGGELRVWGAN